MGCYQSIKDKNFESNSQLVPHSGSTCLGCYQSIKDKNFESNSQPRTVSGRYRHCCYQSIKDKNFESNSQPITAAMPRISGCYQSIKDKNFESNSQLTGQDAGQYDVVISLSKIKISKAIHNAFLLIVENAKRKINGSNSSNLLI